MKIKTVVKGKDTDKRYSIPTVARVIHKSETQLSSFMSTTYGTQKGGMTYDMIKQAISYDYKTQTRISWEDIEEITARLKNDGYVFTETESAEIADFPIDDDEEG